MSRGADRVTSQDVQRTRGGWVPVGTSAARRSTSAETDRGQRTRRQILDAARLVFERDGYLDTSVDDIVRQAGVARGSFYTYFTTKLDVFRAVVLEVSAAIDAAIAARDDDVRLDPVEALRRSNLRAMAALKANGAMYGLTEQLAHIDPQLAIANQSRRRRDIERIAATIRRWQVRGVADPTVDPVPTAAALLSMTRHLFYSLYVAGDELYDETDAAQVVHEVWVRTVDLRARPRRRWLEAVSTTAC